jgi:hypothetical protein
LQQDHIVVNGLIRIHVFILDDLLQPCLEDALDKVLEVLGFKKAHHLPETNHFKQEQQLDLVLYLFVIEPFQQDDVER